MVAVCPSEPKNGSRLLRLGALLLLLRLGLARLRLARLRRRRGRRRGRGDVFMASRQSPPYKSPPQPRQW